MLIFKRTFDFLILHLYDIKVIIVQAHGSSSWLHLYMYTDAKKKKKRFIYKSAYFDNSLNVNIAYR